MSRKPPSGPPTDAEWAAIARAIAQERLDILAERAGTKETFR